MIRTISLLTALGLGIAGFAPPVLAQGTPASPPAAQQRPAAPAAPAASSAQLEPGANSFTEAQARSRFEEAGYQNVMDLQKDDQGIWRARATRGGQQVRVGLDYRGNIATQ